MEGAGKVEHIFDHGLKPRCFVNDNIGFFTIRGAGRKMFFQQAGEAPDCHQGRFHIVGHPRKGTSKRCQAFGLFGPDLLTLLNGNRFAQNHRYEQVIEDLHDSGNIPGAKSGPRHNQVGEQKSENGTKSDDPAF
jgi:hypothetical protein